MTIETQELLELRLDELLEDLASDSPVPRSGSVAALVVAMAAAVVAMAARSSRGWPDSLGTIAQAETLRARAATLVEADALALADARELLAGEGAFEARDRDRLLGDALARAALVPLRIAQVASDVAALAYVAAEHAGESRPDAAAAAALAHGAARAAAHLVEINLAASSDDGRAASARLFVAAAAASAEAALSVEGRA